MPTRLSRGVDYLGALGARLRDLQGTATLVHELIQNADDAPGASHLQFDVRSDGLLVWNDGAFSDCGSVEVDECPWRDDGDHDRLCDFHRFRLVASGDKRRELGTTGAFGVGFTAVYQITDRPEVFSAGQHWIVEEEQSESERIVVCRGECERCREPQIPGTRFWLPWARDPETPLRRALRAGAVDANTIKRLPDEIANSLPGAAIFLKKLTRLQMLRSGSVAYTVLRRLSSDGARVEVSDAHRTYSWWVLEGTFEEQAEQLRRSLPDQIEAKRGALVQVALPLSSDEQLDGWFYACLPTQHATALPILVNADFFPSSDRKRLVLEGGYQATWNRAAIGAAATRLSMAISELPTALGARALWEMLASLHRVRADRTIGVFWEKCEPLLRQAKIVLTTTGDWRPPSEALLLQEEEEEVAVPVLEALGIEIVAIELRPFFSLLRHLGVTALDALRLGQELEESLPTEPLRRDDLPFVLADPGSLELLWREVDRLLVRIAVFPERAAAAKELLRRVAITPTTNGLLAPCQLVHHTDRDTMCLFGEGHREIYFLDEEADLPDGIAALCDPFTVEAAVEELEGLFHAHDQPSVERCVALLRWFDQRSEAVLADGALKQRVARLPIFPSSSGCRALSELALPGGFADPVGLSSLVDVEALRGRVRFLIDLGASPLTLSRYIHDHLARALDDPATDTGKRRAAAKLLADHLGEIRDDRAVRGTLASIPCVECRDGEFRRGHEVYFSGVAEALLGPKVPVADIPHDRPQSVRELYVWLGVSQEPRIEDLLRRVREIGAQSVSAETIELVSHLVRYLGSKISEEEEDLEETDWTGFRELFWLPARNDRNRWYRPAEVFSVFQAHLFSSVGRFLDVPVPIQQSAPRFLKFMGVASEPPVGMVVEHLLSCSKSGTDVNQDVYRFLDDNAGDAKLSLLRDSAWILLASRRYVSSKQVYWGPHEFERFRYQLAPDLRRFQRLFSQLGVKETPQPVDALDVLREISAEFGSTNRPLDEAAHNVAMACWELLDRGLEGDPGIRRGVEKLAHEKVVPTSDGVLTRPTWVFFEDLAGLARRFPQLERNVIQNPVQGAGSMTVAGVRSLADAVEAELVECGNVRDAHELAAHICGRFGQLRRVLAAHHAGDAAARIESGLGDLAAMAADRLVVRYSVRAFEARTYRSEPEDVLAHLSTGGALYFVAGESGTPWRQISRELAFKWCPEQAPGPLASALAQVFAAESDEEAALVLDDLGYPPVAERRGPQQEGERQVGLGGEAAPAAGALRKLSMRMRHRTL